MLLLIVVVVLKLVEKTLRNRRGRVGLIASLHVEVNDGRAAVEELLRESGMIDYRCCTIAHTLTPFVENVEMSVGTVWAIREERGGRSVQQITANCFYRKISWKETTSWL